MTKPVWLTVATAALLVLQPIVLPDRVAPFALRSCAETCVVPPGLRVVWGADSVTVATGTVVTVRLALPDRPSLVAVMVAEPGATAVTSPELETVATADDDVDHSTTRPVSAVPLASRTAAVACVVAPACSDEEGRVTLTDATAAGVGEGGVGLPEPPPFPLPPQAATRDTIADSSKL